MSFIVRFLNGRTQCDLLQQGVLINYTHGADFATIANKNLQKRTQKPFYDHRLLLLVSQGLSRVLNFFIY